MLHDAELVGAIQSKRVIHFIYTNKSRVAHPYVLGIDGDGDTTLIAWEVSSGPGTALPRWKRYHVAKLSSLSIGLERFERVQPDYSGAPKDIVRVLAKV